MKNSILVLLVTLSFLSCKKANDDNNYPYYFTATINGVSVKYEADDLNSSYGAGISQPQSSTDPDYDVYEGAVIQDLTNPSENNSIYVHILKHFTEEPTLEQREAMIHTGTYNFGFSHVSSSTVDGASIDYIDKDGKYWKSELGSQSSSSFIITELIDNPESLNGKIFKATFNCKLYDEDGASIVVSNATIRGKILGL